LPARFCSTRACNRDYKLTIPILWPIPGPFLLQPGLQAYNSYPLGSFPPVFAVPELVTGAVAYNPYPLRLHPGLQPGLQITIPILYGSIWACNRKCRLAIPILWAVPGPLLLHPGLQPGLQLTIPILWPVAGPFCSTRACNRDCSLQSLSFAAATGAVAYNPYPLRLHLGLQPGL
jgi:hypothetical protein